MLNRFADFYRNRGGTGLRIKPGSPEQCNFQVKTYLHESLITMIHQIFIEEKPFIICDEISTSLQEEINQNKLIVMEEPEIKNVPSFLHTLKDPSVYGYVWKSSHPGDILQILMKNFEHWQAAGGLISNIRGDILFIFRLGKWDLPKGKIEGGETPEIAAVREVREETGLINIHIGSKLTETWHAYHQFGKDIIKQTHWFKMQFTGTELTVPQIEEDILDIQWIKPENIGKYLRYSYPNLKLVFREAGYQI